MLSTDKQTNRQTDKLTNQRYQKHNKTLSPSVKIEAKYSELADHEERA